MEQARHWIRAASSVVVLTGGSSVLNIVATSPSGATARVVRTVVFDFTPGTVVLDVGEQGRLAGDRLEAFFEEL